MNNITRNGFSYIINSGFTWLRYVNLSILLIL